MRKQKENISFSYNQDMKPMQAANQKNTRGFCLFVFVVLNKINSKEAESIIQTLPMPNQNHPYLYLAKQFQVLPLMNNHFTNGTN